MHPEQFSCLELAFQRAQNAVIELLHGECTLSNLSVARPKRADSEGDFLRLVAWCFAACCEVGRVFVPFFFKRSYGGATDNELKRCKDIMATIGDLRTISFHNVGFTEERDETTRRRAEAWFVLACGYTEPNDDPGYQQCFVCLANDVRFIAEIIETAAKSLLSADDRDEVVDGLIRALKRNLPGYVYDSYIVEAAALMEVRLDAKSFREQHLASWRKTAELLTEDGDLHGVMRREIQAAVARYVSQRSPLDADEWMRVLEIGRGKTLGFAIKFSIDLMAQGTMDKDLIIQRVKERFASPTE